MTESLIFQKFIQNAKCNTIYHGSVFYNLAFKYFIEEALSKKLTTEAEFDDMKTFQLYSKYETFEPYFTLIPQTTYNLTELTVIVSSIHDCLLVYLDTIGIFYTTVQNYYGRGKIKLNRNDPDDFIKQVIETTSKYDPKLIKKQINTIQLYELVIKSIIKVIDTFVVPVLPEPFRRVFNSQKDIASEQIKESSNDYSSFTGQNIDILKKQYKKDNRDLYILNIEFINKLSNMTTYKDCFVIIYSCNFTGIKPQNVTKSIIETYKIYGDRLETFVSSKFPVDKICRTITEAFFYNGALSKILPTYYVNLALHKYINRETGV